MQYSTRFPILVILGLGLSAGDADELQESARRRQLTRITLLHKIQLVLMQP